VKKKRPTHYGDQHSSNRLPEPIDLQHLPSELGFADQSHFIMKSSRLRRIVVKKIFFRQYFGTVWGYRE